MSALDGNSDIVGLAAEHASIKRHLDHAKQIADSVGYVSVDELRQWLDHAMHTIGHQFVPHAQREERLLYAGIPDAQGAPSLAALLRRDHLAFAELVAELKPAAAKVGEPLDPDLARELRRILYGMYAILKLHFDTDDELYRHALEEKTHGLRDGG